MPTVTDRARKTVESGRRLTTDVGSQATHRLQAALRDGALATVGVGDQVVRQFRTLSDRVRDLDVRTDEGRKEFEQRLAHLRENAAAEFEQFVARGREVVEGVGNSRAAERATSQTKVATSQVKAAATSVRKLADVGAQQAFVSATRFRQAADETAGQADTSAAQAKAAATSVGKAADRATDVVADAAQRIGTRRTEVPLEDLKFTELRELAKQRDIEGRAAMNKAELIEALREE
jgi:hypothetical protein